MKDRIQIKMQAKETMKNQYGMSIAVFIIMTIVSMIITKVGEGDTIVFQNFGYVLRYGIDSAHIIYQPGNQLLGWLLSIFVMAPLSVGVGYHFLCVYRGQFPPVSTAFDKGFANNYLRKVGGVAWMWLWTFLWSLLLVIPGIIKFFSYAMTPYILADYPNVQAKEALKISMRMMQGHKADLFILGLSYIGWYILCGLTFGLLLIFYVGPYSQCAYAGFYQERMAQCLADGTVREEELV